DHGTIAIASDMRAEWLRRVEHLGDQGLRVLGCAVKTGLQVDAAPYEGVTFIGLVGLEDPARADVPPAVQKCRLLSRRKPSTCFPSRIVPSPSPTARAMLRAVTA